MSDKILFLELTPTIDFYKAISDEVEFSPFERWLDEIKGDKESIEYILSNDNQYIFLYRPLNKEKNYILNIKKKLNDADYNFKISLADDVDDTYKDESVYGETYGLNLPFKITFDKTTTYLEDFLSKGAFFRLNNYEWYYEDDGTMEEDNLVYPEIADLVEWSNDSQKLIIKELEELRFLSFKFLVSDARLIGFDFYEGSLDLVNALIWNLNQDKKDLGCNIYVIVNEDVQILIKDKVSFDYLQYLMKISGTKSW